MSATGNFATANVGSGKAVTSSGFTISGTDAGDYSLTTPSLSDADGKIDAATLTITASNVSGTYGSVASTAPAVSPRAGCRAATPFLR